MKRSLSFFLSVLLLLCLKPLAARAEENNYILAGQNLTFDLAAYEERDWLFTSKETGAYTVTLENASTDISIRVFDRGEIESLIYNATEMAQVYLEYGHTYVITVSNNSESPCYNVQLSLERGGVIQSVTLNLGIHDAIYGNNGECQVFVGEQHLELCGTVNPDISVFANRYSSNVNVATVRTIMTNEIGHSMRFGAAGEATYTFDLGDGLTSSYKFIVEEPSSIALGDTWDFSMDPYERLGATFTPDEDGTYYFFMANGSVTHLKVEGDSLPDVDGDKTICATSNNDCIDYECQAGVTYLITATNLDSAQTVSDVFRVEKAEPITAIKIEPFTIYAGYAQFVFLNVTAGDSPFFIPEEVTWTTSDPSILTISEVFDDGCNVQALAEGTVTLTATTASGLSDSYTVTVEEYSLGITGNLSLGQKNPISIWSEDDYGNYQFIPSESGYYLFDHDAPLDDAVIAIYDEEFNILQGYYFFDDKDLYPGFAYWLDKGETYYILSYYYDTTVFGDYNLYVEKLPNQENGWVSARDGWFYYQNGELYTGWLQEGGKTYFLRASGAMVIGWYTMTDTGKTYYFDHNGIMQTGVVTIDGTTYCFEANGALCNGWVQYNGNWYYADSNGVMQTGWLGQGSDWYYLNSDGTMATGWVSSGGKWYYMNSKGIMQTGWVSVNGNWYYMNSGGIMQTGWLSQGGKWYYLRSNGIMATGPLNIGGTTYLFDANGIMATGWAQYNGKWYYANSNGVMQTGWLGQGSDWYYLNSDGTMATGWVGSGGKWYYMNSKGIMQTGWVSVNGSWYYLNSGGIMQTGWLSQGGKWYYLRSNGIMATGPLNIGGTTYLFGESGIMATGWVQYKGNWYYANSNGVVQTGWVGVGKNWYYMDANGVMQTGWVGIGKNWYYLDSNGVMVTGTKVIDGTTYKFDANGVWIG